MAVAAIAATYRRGVVSSASVKDRWLTGVPESLPRRAAIAERIRQLRRVYASVRARPHRS